MTAISITRRDVSNPVMNLIHSAIILSVIAVFVPGVFAASTRTEPADTQLSTSAHERDKRDNAAAQTDPTHFGPGGQSAPDTLRVNFPTPRGVAPPTRCRTVFGFLPYWQSASNIQWNVLSHVACFDIDVGEQGQVVNARGWPWTATINTARQNNVKVILTVSNFSPTEIAALLGSPTARQALFTNLANLIRSTADGIVIDFEGTNTPAWQSQMTQFVIDMRAALNAQLAPATPEIWVATPAVNWAGSSGWNFAALAQAADGLFIMGYDFYGSWSSTSGPSSPLSGGSFNVTNTVLSQYATARLQNPRKLVLGVPYYGNRWRTTTSSAYAPSTSFVQSILYSQAATEAALRGRQWDGTSQTPWYRYQDSTSWNQVWFDDADSLLAKYQLAKSNGLGGVGMWALNYDGTRPELWNLLRQEFVFPCSCRADFNQTGGLTVSDIFSFLAAWFAGCTGQSTSPCLSQNADFDSSGGLTVTDIFAFLTAWFAGC